MKKRRKWKRRGGGGVSSEPETAPFVAHQTPSKLLSKFNETNNLTIDSPQSLFKTPAPLPGSNQDQQAPDTLETIASSLQVRKLLYCLSLLSCLTNPDS